MTKNPKETENSQGCEARVPKLINRKMQIKTTLKGHITSFRLARI